MAIHNLNYKRQKPVLLLVILFLVSFLTPGQNNIVKIEPITISQTEMIPSASSQQLKSANGYLHISGDESILQNRPPSITLQLGNILLADNYSLPGMVSLDAYIAIDPESKLVTGTQEGDKTIDGQIATYKGLIGDDGWINLSFTHSGMVGLLRFNGSTHVIQPIQFQTIDKTNNRNLKYAISNQKESGRCGVDTESLSPQIKQLMATLNTSVLKSASLSNQLIVKLAVETDYETYVSFGKDSLLTTAYLLSIIDNVSQIYKREVNIKLQVVFSRVWTTPEDPYTQIGYSLYPEFANYWNAKMQNIERDAALLIIRADSRLAGGLASLDALCNKQSAYAISGQGVYTVAHELGHIFGSPHTHNCSWPAGPNGTLAPIDKCASVEGGCGITEIIYQEGTIMSYCPTVSEVFHPLCRNLIRARAEANPCIGSGLLSSNTITGKVTWNSLGLANVTVKADGGDGKIISTITKEDGSFSLTLLNNDYTIRAEKDSFLITPIGYTSSRSIYVTLAGLDVTGVNFEAVDLLSDQYEPDNNRTDATYISTNGDLQYHTIHQYFDDDFVCFDAVAGQTYFLSVRLKNDGFLPVISLLDVDGITELANGSYPPSIEWKAIRKGKYFVRIYGDKGSYGLSVITSAFLKVATNVTPLMYSTADWGDYDGDNDYDLLIGGMNDKYIFDNFLYRNDFGQLINNMAGIDQIPSTSSYVMKWVDFDNDGDLDAFIGTGDFASIYINEGGIFRSRKTIDDKLGWIQSADFGDFDKDGDLDILIQSWSDWNYGEYPRLSIYRNDKVTFVKTLLNIQGVNFGKAKWVDYNGDGNLDIIVAGSSTKSGDPSSSNSDPFTKVYRNDNGNFIDANSTIKPVTGSPDFGFGDFDSDGDLDLVIAGKEASKLVTKIYRNDNGVYIDMNAELTGVRNAKIAWGDYDNDGDLDLIITGYTREDASASSVTKLYINKGGKFDESLFNGIFPGITGTVNGSDYDGDSDLDLFLTGAATNREWQAYLMRNETDVINAPPSAPSILNALIGNRIVTLSWTPSPDDRTPIKGLTYNIRIGTSPGGIDVLSPMSDLNTGKRKIVDMGNVGQLSQHTLYNLPPNRYYWSVQSIDNSFSGSHWATEQTFTIGNTIPIAKAGVDQSVNEGATISLDGSSSTDPDGNPLTYKWTAPPGITLNSTTAQKPTFTAPEVSTNTDYTFSLVVNDGIVNSLPATVKVTIVNVINVGVSNLDVSFCKIYPNPTTGIVNIELPNGTGHRTEVLVTSLVGTEICRKVVNDASKFRIDISNQINGIYLLKINYENVQYITKIIIAYQK